MDVRELRHRVADGLVDVAGDLAAHRVRERDVHVRRRERGRHRLEAVADRDHDVGLQPLERGRELEQAEPGRLRHRRRRLALDQHEHALVGLEAVLLDQVLDAAVAVEQRGGADDELQLELGVGRDGAHRRLDARVVRARADDDADLPHASSVLGEHGVGGDVDARRSAERPRGSRARGSRCPASWPPPSRARSRRRRGSPAVVTTDFSNTCFISPNGSRSSLSTGLASIVSISRMPSTRSSNSSRLGREARVRAVQIAGEREVLLDDGRAERRPRRTPRSSRACGRRSRRACRSARAARASTFRPTRSGGVGYCDVHCSTVTSSPAAATAASSSAHERHPRRQQHRLAGRGGGAHELEVRDLAGADLVARHADAPRAARRPRSRTAEQRNSTPARLARGLQRRPLLVGERRALEVLPARLVLEVRGRRRVARGLGLGVVQLELDRVDAALGRDLRHADRVAEAPVVGHPDFGDDVDRAHRGDASFAS